jgi:hypothetical protein
MELEKIKKYLQAYLDDIITPYLNSELIGEEDEPIEVKVRHIKQKQHNSDEIVVFLDMEPDWSNGSIVPNINTDIGRFMNMLGLRKKFIIAWNKRPEPIYEPRKN